MQIRKISSSYFEKGAKDRVVVPLVALGGLLAATQLSGQALPTDVKMLVPASNTSLSFTDWFKNHDPMTLDAEVLAADSLNFSDQPNGDFYRWSYQMFLWVTSPAKSSYGGSGRVFSSPEFYNVSPPDPVTGERTMTANRVNPLFGLSGVAAEAQVRRRLVPPEPQPLGLRVANLGPNGLPFIKTRDGRFLEVLPVAKSARGLPVIDLGADRRIEVSRARLVPQGATRRIEFLAPDGKAVPLQRMLPAPRFERMFKLDTPGVARLNAENFAFKLDAVAAQRLKLGKLPVFITRAGTVINPEVAQSDGAVLLTQSGSLIYYAIAVNDVYAYFLTGQKNGAITANKFPVNAGTLAAVTSFAVANGRTFLNPNALAVELKSSWVEASAVADPSKYITMRARVPVYDTSDPAHWVQTGSKVVKVAMVGMHVVGSTKGHPEMVWASFEHVGNAANVSYKYTRASPPGLATGTQPADPVGGANVWLFSATPIPTFPFLSRAASGGANDIVSGDAGGNIAPTSILRMAPWGAPSDHAPNPLATAARSNAEVISLNRDVRAQMNPADVRSNYLFLGATWTAGGAMPSENFDTNVNTQNIVGTNHLANATMETFTQSGTWVVGDFPGPGCLSCHSTNTIHTSHIYSGIKPLF